jgi:hypothetical protein
MKRIYLALLLLPVGLKMNAQYGPACPVLGDLCSYLMVFTNGNVDANLHGSKGFAGNIAVNGLTASEHTSGSTPYAGLMVTNANSLGAWQNIINANTSQSSSAVNNTWLLTMLGTKLEAAFTTINLMPATAGFTSRSSSSLNNLNTANGICQTIVINIKSGFTVSSKIYITGDPYDLFIFRWDTDANPLNGYNGKVTFQNGGAFVPLGDLNASNFIHVAGDISSNGGGSTPPAPYPQGPRTSNGLGDLIEDGSDFDGGGFFTGYWLTTGAPTIFPVGQQPYGPTSSLSDAVFVGGWYSKTTKFTFNSCSNGGVNVNGCMSRKMSTGEVPVETPVEKTEKKVEKVESKTTAFSTTVMSNPAVNDFTLRINSPSQEPVSMQLMDMSGKLISVINQKGGTTYTSFGSTLLPGTYIVIVKQGNNRQVVKLIKL